MCKDVLYWSSDYGGMEFIQKGERWREYGKREAEENVLPIYTMECTYIGLLKNRFLNGTPPLSSSVFAPEVYLSRTLILKHQGNIIEQE